MELMLFWNFIAEFDEAYDFHRKKIMKQYNLTAMEVDVLLFLANNPSLNTSSDIVQYRKIAKSHVSLAVKELANRGYLSRTMDEKNKKRIRLVPTEAAQEIIAYGREEQRKFGEIVRRRFTDEDRAQFREFIQRIYENLQEEY